MSDNSHPPNGDATTALGENAAEPQHRFQISEWDGLFENNKSRQIDTCSWVKMPNKHDGEGYTELIECHDSGPAHFGFWCALVQVCSKQRAPRNGWLTRNGTQTGIPYTIAALARKTRMPEKIVSEALSRFVQIGWVTAFPGSVTARSPRGHREVTSETLTPAPKPTENAKKDAFLDGKDTARSPRGHREVTSGPRSALEEKGKNALNGMEGKKEAATEVPASFLEIAQQFHNQQRENYSRESIWADIDKLNRDGAKELFKYKRLENWSEEEIIEVLGWILQSDEWRPNVRSLRGVRKKGRNGSMRLENARAWMQRENGSGKGSGKSVIDLAAELSRELEID